MKAQSCGVVFRRPTLVRYCMVLLITRHLAIQDEDDTYTGLIAQIPAAKG